MSKTKTRNECYKGYKIIRTKVEYNNYKELSEKLALKINKLVIILSEIEKLNKSNTVGERTPLKKGNKGLY